MTPLFQAGQIAQIKATGEIVDNCQKRPQSLFDEQSLGIDECAGYLAECVRLLQQRNADVRVVVTVSPIRYRKYGYHGSRLSKATLLLAADKLAGMFPDVVSYFPAYEIVMDELRDYRFYDSDMVHPSPVAVDYIWEKFRDAYFTPEQTESMKESLKEWKRSQHRPLH